MLSDEELLRYSRQILLKQVDIAGQLKLKQSRVLIVGLGGLGSPVVLGPMLAGAALITAFVLHALRTEEPLIDLGLFRNRTFTVASLTMVLFSIAFFGAMLLMPLYFQSVRGESAPLLPWSPPPPRSLMSSWSSWPTASRASPPRAWRPAARSSSVAAEAAPLTRPMPAWLA